MTQREQDIALIRSKCIEVNPDIDKTCGAWCGMYTSCVRDRHNGTEIRLADVLLAIHNISGWNYFLADVTGKIFHQERPEEGRWNLYKDDLAKQSDATISFLASLLK